MTRRTVVLLACLTVLIGAACASGASGAGPDQGTAASPSRTLTAQAGGVTVTATWEDPGAGLSFHVKLDNHQIDLDGVTLAGAVLTNDRGDRLDAKPWFALPGGHHREGSLLFNGTSGPFLAGATWVELSLPPIGSNTVPPLRWTLRASS